MDIFEKYFVKWLKKSDVLREGHFQLTSGRHSDLYIDKDVIYRTPELAGEILQALGKLISEAPEIDVITGPAIAGALLSFPISISMSKAFVYPEKIDNNMVFRRGYDKFLNGKRVAIAEDIITTGGSVQKTIDAIVSCGGTPVIAVAIWNRSSWTHPEVDVKSLIDRPVESWAPEDCPLCKQGIPLKDPKERTVHETDHHSG